MNRLTPSATRTHTLFPDTTLCRVPKVTPPPADILKSRHIQKIAPPGRSGCHLKISPTYNHMMPHRWRAFYLAIDFPFRFRCIALFSSEERRVGYEFVSKCSSRWSLYP